MEPVLGEGGFYPAHPLAAGALEEVCRDNGILFVSDEVQTGFGRCGAPFACERYGIVPDMITMAKSLAGGLPLSAVTGLADIMDAPPIGGIGGTFAGNPVACAAANAVLDVMEEEDLPGRARRFGDRILRAFGDLAKRHDHVGAFRGLGAMCGLEIVDPGTGEPDPARVRRILDAARGEGLLAMPASGNVIRTLMPLNISDEDLDRGLDILSRAVAA
jgi:4-aminobutyrate aminotransferase-like enzyme